MSTVLDPPDCTTAIRAADRLRTTMAAVRVSLSWLGVRKTLTAEQKVHAAESFGDSGRIPLGRKEAARYASPRLPGSERSPLATIVLLERDDTAVSRARNTPHSANGYYPLR